MTQPTSKVKILFYDIESAPLQAWVWNPGDQYVGHKQLVKGRSQHGIICIGYAWNDGKDAECIDWGYNKQSTKSVIKAFDKIAAKADVIVGKNSAKFDNKMVNAARMLNGLPGLPNWAMSHEDIEQQMRKHFKLPSQSLEYITQELGLGGKSPMEFSDWVDIVEKNDPSKLTKMTEYCKRDVELTRTLWTKLSEHFDSKFNTARHLNLGMACKRPDCGSVNIAHNGTRMSGGSKYQMYTCKDCGRYAGKTAISAATGKEGANIK